MPDILDRIRDLMKEYVDRHREEPNAVRVAKGEENDFLTISMDRLPDDVAKKLFVEGPRKAFERLWGMKVFWDCDKTEVVRIKTERRPVGAVRRHRPR